jgi:hypothetical protein
MPTLKASPFEIPTLDLNEVIKRLPTDVFGEPDSLNIGSDYSADSHTVDYLSIKDGAPLHHRLPTNGPITLQPQRVGGAMVSPPSESEIQAQLEKKGHFFLKDFVEPAAFYNGKINVIRDEANRTVTLLGRGSIYGPLNYQVAADAMDRWDGLSYKHDDGYTYQSNVKFSTTDNSQDADVRLNYRNEPRDKVDPSVKTLCRLV